jgi:hypothetical protein
MVGKVKEIGSYQQKNEIVKLQNEIGFFFISLSTSKGKE